MLIPYSTDAPIYHLPIVTVSLIAINTVTFIGAHLGVMGTPDDWLLEYGVGYRPLQWLQCNFMHADFLHLLGNMFFLWAFGLIVEGKLGWWKFLLVYLGIGVGFGFSLQTVMYSLPEAVMAAAAGPIGGAGASGVLFGLLAIAAVWAPRNDMQCLLLIHFIPKLLSVPVLTFGAIFFLWEFVCLSVFEPIGGTAYAHLTGGVIGFAVGTVFVKTNLVDCEKWDLFNVLRGTHGGSAAQRFAKIKTSEKAAEMTAQNRQRNKQNQLESAREQIGVFVQQGNLIAAGVLFQKFAPQGLTIAEPQLRAIIAGYHKEDRWRDSLPLMASYLRAFPDSVPMRLALAHALIEQERRPAKALDVLEALGSATLTSQQDQLWRKLMAQALELQQDADLEIDDGTL